MKEKSLPAEKNQECKKKSEEMRDYKRKQSVKMIESPSTMYEPIPQPPHNCLQRVVGWVLGLRI